MSFRKKLKDFVHLNFEFTRMSSDAGYSRVATHPNYRNFFLFDKLLVIGQLSQCSSVMLTKNQRGFTDFVTYEW